MDRKTFCQHWAALAPLPPVTLKYLSNHLAAADRVGSAQRVVDLGVGHNPGSGRSWPSGLPAAPALRWGSPDPVGSAVDLAAADAAARQRDREDLAPVVPAAVAVQSRRAAELGHAHDQRLVEQSPRRSRSSSRAE